MKNLSKITLFIISVSTMRTEKRKQDEILCLETSMLLLWEIVY